MAVPGCVLIGFEKKCNLTGLHLTGRPTGLDDQRAWMTLSNYRISCTTEILLHTANILATWTQKILPTSTDIVPCYHPTLRVDEHSWTNRCKHK